MKTMKKLLALTLALAMVLSLALTVAAEEQDTPPTYTITIPNETPGHTYEAYKIFTGTVVNKDKTMLADIDWGTGVDSASLLSGLQSDAVLGTTFAGCKTAEDVAKKLTADNSEAFSKIVAKHLTTTKTTSTFDTTNKKYTISSLEPGYYFVKDQDDFVPNYGAYTKFILEVVNNVTTELKTGDVMVEKKVEDLDDSTGAAGVWGDSADHDINDIVNYKITGDLPANLDQYDTYYYEFTDTLSKGLTLTAGSVKVYVVNDGVETEVTNSFTIANPVASTDTTGDYVGGNVLSVKIDDLTTITSVTKDSKIVVKYTAQLNTDAKIGADGNPNKVTLTYSNNPNYSGQGETNPKGTTPADVVIVFTYKAIVNKVTEGETSTPENPVYVPLKGATFKLSKFVASATGKENWKDVTGDWVELTLTPNQNGDSFSFSGLDAGEYKLEEVNAPDGYNKIEEIKYFTVEATHNDPLDTTKETLEVLQVKDKDGNVIGTPNKQTGVTYEWDVTLSSGELKTQIINNSGVKLPSTGGIGTTIFYIVGGLLTVGAVILLVTKKKMSAAE